ncbi:MAG: MerR family transcriptional regulator [Emcibacter sp.]|nr:MerR family transcriptional regulator [Emcibacter sp.]
MTSNVEKSQKAFRTISEVANSMGVPQHVLRFWESKFSQINPMKRGGGRRYYRPEDVQIIEVIRKLLHEDGYTIKGAQKYLKEFGVDHVLKDNDTHSPDQYEAQILKVTAPLKSSHLDGNIQSIEDLRKIRDRLVIVKKNLKNI